MKGPAWMIGEPLHHGGMLMGRVTVEDGVDDLALRRGALDRGEKADELLMPMLLHAAADDGSVQNIERGEQGGRAVSLVVVGHGPAFSGFERQAGLCTLERLDMALLVDGDHDGVSRRVHIEADDILDLLGKLWIGRPLEGSDAMRLEAMLLPEALHRPQRDPHDFRHGAACPMSGGAGRLRAGQFENSGDELRVERGAARLAGLVAQQAIDALFAITLLSAPGRRTADAGGPGDLQNRKPLGRKEPDLCTLDMFERPRAIRGDRAQSRRMLLTVWAMSPGSHAELQL